MKERGFRNNCRPTSGGTRMLYPSPPRSQPQAPTFFQWIFGFYSMSADEPSLFFFAKYELSLLCHSHWISPVECLRFFGAANGVKCKNCRLEREVGSGTIF